LKLEDVTFPFRHPSVLDLKMGTQTYDESAKPEKIAAEVAKYPPQKELGFRFTGMKAPLSSPSPSLPLPCNAKAT